MAETTPKIGLSKPVMSTDTFADMIEGLRANADKIDNLAEQPGSYTSGVPDFTPSSVKAALDALAGVRIVEMGRNANGEYVRWENGLQVCFVRMANVSVTTSPGTEQGLTIYRVTVDWTLPAAFVNPPVVLHVARTSSVFQLASSIMTAGDSTNSVPLLVAMLSDTSLFPRLAALAIGRWR